MAGTRDRIVTHATLVLHLPRHKLPGMDADDFLAALYLCLFSPERHFNVAGIWRTAEGIGQQRRRFKTAR